VGNKFRSLPMGIKMVGPKFVLVILHRALLASFLNAILKSGIVESILSVAKAKEDAKLAKTLGPGKKK